MASGILGRADLAAATDTQVYIPPTAPATVATVTVVLCNRTAAATSVNVALSATATPALTDYIEFGTALPANGVLQLTGIVVGSGDRIIANAAAAGVSCVIYGFEE